MYLFNWLLAPIKDDLKQYAWLAYLVVFGVALAANMTIVAPVYVFTPIMVAAAGIYNPALIALAAALGGSIGEMSGYLAGSLGKKIVFSDYPEAYEKVAGWVDKYGLLAITSSPSSRCFPSTWPGSWPEPPRCRAHRFLHCLLPGQVPEVPPHMLHVRRAEGYLPFCLTREMTDVTFNVEAELEASVGPGHIILAALPETRCL